MHTTQRMQTVDQLLALVEDALRQYDFEGRTPATLYDPMRYILGLRAKRMRPLGVLLAYQSFTDQPATLCINTALAVELFHNFTLMHDDIMDNAPTRRGQPTVHVRWDTNTAILSGDALFAVSIRLLAAEHPLQAAALIDTFVHAALEVCEGQMEDMNLAQRPSATVAEYLEMIRKKTAALLGASLHLGAQAAGATAAEQQALHRFGEQVGIAFQLQDDLLDAYADQEKFGKQVGGDIIENKKTYLWLRAYEKADAAQRQALLHWQGVCTDNAAKVSAVKALYQQLDIIADTEQRIQQYFEAGQAALQPYLHNAGIQQLLVLMQRLIARQA